MWKLIALLLLLWMTPAYAQETVNGGMVILGPLRSNGSASAVDFSTSTATSPVKTGALAARSVSCTVGQMFFATDAMPGQNLYYCTSSGVWTRGGGGGSSNAGPCQLASSLGFALNGTDESALLNSTFASFYAAGGGCLAIDMGKTLRADSQIVLPHAGSWPYASPSYRITSGGMAGGVLGPVDLGTNTGILDLRFHGDSSHPEYGNGPKLMAIGDGNLTIDNVTLTSAAAGDCAAYVMTTGSAIYIHHTTFWGQQGQTAGCSTAIVMGGSQQGTLQSTGNMTDHFGGYGSVVRENRFLMMGRVAWLRSGANGVIIDGNYVSGGNSTTRPHVIDIAGFGLTSDADRANIISNNLIELGGYGSPSMYSCGVNLQNAMQNQIYANQFWDGDLTTYAACGDSTATQNNFDRTNFVDGGGTQIANPTWSSNNYMPYKAIGFFFDGGGAPLSGSATRCSLTSFGGTIAQFAMAADQPGNATVTVKAVPISSYTGPASASDISNGGESLGGAAAKLDTTLTGWSYLARNSPVGSIVQPNMMICFTLSNPSSITWLTGQISIWEGR